MPDVEVSLPPEVSALIRSDTADGFEAFYLMVHNKALPPHARGWVDAIYAVEGEIVLSPELKIALNVLLEAFRGSTKTTTIATYIAYKIGLHPTGSSLLIQSGDDAAQDTTAYIANIIEHNPAWLLCFPLVRPDKSQGWGASGYEVVDTGMDYGEFRRQRQKDPSLLGLGYDSAVAGKHPSLLLVIDDIHDEKNTASDRELNHVIKVFSGTIMPTRSPNWPLMVLVGTPWNTNDVLAKAKATGRFRQFRTPVYSECAQGTKGAQWYPRIGKFVLPAWSSFGVDRIESEYGLDLTGGPEFARMYLLDLEGNKRRLLAYQLFPAELVRFDWVYGGGADPAGVSDPTSRSANHSHFAQSYVGKLLGGGAVITGGILEQCSAGEAIDYIAQAQNLFPNWLGTVMEGDGAGETLFQMVMMKPGIKVSMMKTGNKSKADRIVNGVGPWLRIGRVKISSAETPFLNALRKFANSYPNVGQHDPGWDAWDSVYWSLRGMPDVLTMPDSGELPKVGAKMRLPNPFSGLGQQHH